MCDYSSSGSFCTSDLGRLVESDTSENGCRLLPVFLSTVDALRLSVCCKKTRSYRRHVYHVSVRYQKHKSVIRKRQLAAFLAQQKHAQTLTTYDSNFTPHLVQYCSTNKDATTLSLLPIITPSPGCNHRLALSIRSGKLRALKTLVLQNTELDVVLPALNHAVCPSLRALTLKDCYLKRPRLAGTLLENLSLLTDLTVENVRCPDLSGYSIVACCFTALIGHSNSPRIQSVKIMGVYSHVHDVVYLTDTLESGALRRLRELRLEWSTVSEIETLGCLGSLNSTTVPELETLSLVNCNLSKEVCATIVSTLCVTRLSRLTHIQFGEAVG